MNSIFNNYLQNMILSASGWRTVFALSGNEEDATPEISEEHKAIAFFAASAFSNFLTEKINRKPRIVVGADSRPTGKNIADIMLRALVSLDVDLQFTGIIAAPEIMSYAKNFDGFIYISASHNPIGHNGIKFGFSDGGVMPAQDAKLVIELFKNMCNNDTPVEKAQSTIQGIDETKLQSVYGMQKKYKQAAFENYYSFSKQLVSSENTKEKQDMVFQSIKTSTNENPITVVCDMNGSARCLTIDKVFLNSIGIQFVDFNNEVGNIKHAIIPEGDNLLYCARKIEELQQNGNTNAILGYTPDCDGDRGNIVYWNSTTKKAEILQAQEVFALSVLSELSYSTYKNNNNVELKLAVAINGATSMRIDEIANAFNAQVFRGEVGEANIVNCAREQRENGYEIPILGEGSNGGNITHPAAVRDPLNTLFALIKLLTIRSNEIKMGLFELWCTKSNQIDKYKKDFTFADILQTLPKYITTGVSEQRALLQINSKDHTVLKQNFQKAFIESWTKKNPYLKENYSIVSWSAAATVGTKEITEIEDFGISGTGGLKIRFLNETRETIATMWMRGSGTESVFRILCDVKGSNTVLEKELIDWETQLLEKADKM